MILVEDERKEELELSPGERGRYGDHKMQGSKEDLEPNRRNSSRVTFKVYESQCVGTLPKIRKT